jgi:hypothetical protein
VAESGAPDALLGVEGRKHYGFVVDAGGVTVDGGGGLSAEVAVAKVEVEGADVVGTVGAGELHASLDARDGVKALHSSSLVFWCGSERHEGRAAKVMSGGAEGSSKVGMKVGAAAETPCEAAGCAGEHGVLRLRLIFELGARKSVLAQDDKLHNLRNKG